MKEITLIFKAYLEQLNKQFDKSEYLLKQILDDNLIQDNPSALATMLFVVMEQIERSKSREMFDQYHEKLNDYADVIINNWNKPEGNIWGDNTNLIHISNLGIYYGALNAFKRVTGNEDLQKELISIRDYVFDNGLYKGTLVRSTKSKEVSTDLLATVVPFGPEDLVVVEAVEEIENNLYINESVYRYQGGQNISPTSSAWLAWYFAEKGNMKKAKFYLRISEKLNEKHETEEKELANVFINIATHFIDEIFQSNSEIKIIHTPYGNANLYEKLKTERFPRDPEVNQDVKVRSQIWPYQENIQVCIRVETPKRKYEIPCSKIIDGNEIVWEASIGKFDFDESVNYYFIIKENDNVIKEGDNYSFSPTITNCLTSVQNYGQNGNTFWIEGKDQFKINTIYFGITNTDNGIQFKVDFNQNSFAKFLQEGETNNLNKSMEYFIDEEKIIVKNNYWVCHLFKSPFYLKVYNLSGDILLQGYKQILPILQWLVNNDGEINKVKFNFLTPLNERFFGFGERFNRIEQRGEKLDCYVYNQYRDQGTKTYIPVPFYLSSLGYGLYIESPNYSQFDMASYFEDLLSISSDISSLKSLSFRIFIGGPKEIINEFTKLTGKPILPPKWAFGPWMSSNNWDRDSIVRKQVELTNHYKIPATVLVIEQWSDESTYYIFNDASYDKKNGKEFFNYEEFDFPEWGRWANPKKLIEDLHDDGLKVILWQIPIQKYLNKQFHLQKDEDEKQMIEAGFCVKNSDGEPYRIPEGWFKESLLIDFSNEEGKKWWFNKRKYLLDIGVDGFKTDGGEFVFGNDLQFSDGKTGAEMRNQYPNDYVQAYYSFVNDYYHGNGLTFSRAGFTGAQNYPVHWAGDERSTFLAFKNSLIAGLTSGISGIPFWGWDLAGFNGDVPSAELFIRSAQMAAFCPIMQYHAESKGEFNQDRTPWNIAERTGDKDAINGYRYYANVRMNLLPYIYDQSRVTSITGIPLMRALLIDYPNDERTYSIYDQYMFGDNLLVAPVIEEGKTERMVYFPKGRWIDIWSNEIINGPTWNLVESSLMEIPVYVKQDSAILCNCDDTLSLGSWVGNSVEQYTLPVMRIYPKEGFKQVIDDHLNQVWTVEVNLIDEVWNITIESSQEVIIMLPVELIHQKEIIINGSKKSINILEVRDQNYIVKII